MTPQQLKTIEGLYQAYKSNMEEYSEWKPEDYCSFGTYQNQMNADDRHIVVVWVRIRGLSAIELPQNEILNLLIEESGAYYDMDVLTDVFESRSQIVEYIEKLTKFDWRGK